VASTFDALFTSKALPILNSIHGRAGTWFAVASGASVGSGTAVTLLASNASAPEGFDGLEASVPAATIASPEMGDYWTETATGVRWTVVGVGEPRGGSFPLELTAPHVRR
jgi:hypothetical protein